MRTQRPSHWLRRELIGRFFAMSVPNHPDRPTIVAQGGRSPGPVLYCLLKYAIDGLCLKGASSTATSHLPCTSSPSGSSQARLMPASSPPANGCPRSWICRAITPSAAIRCAKRLRSWSAGVWWFAAGLKGHLSLRRGSARTLPHCAASVAAWWVAASNPRWRSEEHTSELQSPDHLVCRLLLEKKKAKHNTIIRPSSPITIPHSH